MSEELHEFYEEFDRYIDSVPGSGEEEYRSRANAIILRIESLLESHPCDAGLHHRMGLCLYELPSWDEEVEMKLESSFSRAINLDDRADMSRTYLSYYYFDVGRYSLCLSTLDDIRLLGSSRYYWTCVNLRIMKVACELMVGNVSEKGIADSLDVLVDWYQRLDEFDRDCVRPAFERMREILDSSEVRHLSEIILDIS